MSPEVNKTVLDNGVRLISESLPSAYSTSVGLWVESGSRDEDPAQGGASHFIEHMAFKGTARRGPLEIARVIDRLGGHANAFTSKENTCFHGRALTEHLAEMVDVLVDIFAHPAYDPVELERERQVILQEIFAVEDTPDDLVHVLFGQNFWPDHPLGRPVLGTVETVTALGRDTVMERLAAAYVPANLVVAAAGALSHDDLLNLLAEPLGKLPVRPSPLDRRPPRHTPGLNVTARPSEQAHVVLGAPAPGAAEPERFASALLNIILGGNMSSRLFQEVRERRGLAYAVFSFQNTYADCGVQSVYLGVAPERAAEAVRVVMDEMARLGSEALDEAELADAKDHLKGSILLAAESTDTRMSRLAKNEFNFGRHKPLSEVIAELEAVTAEQVVALTRDILARDKLAVTVLGPVDPEALSREAGL